LYFNSKGLLTATGEKKKAYFVLQDYYRELQDKPSVKSTVTSIP